MWLKTSHLGPPEAPSMVENSSGTKPSRTRRSRATVPARRIKLCVIGKFDSAHFEHDLAEIGVGLHALVSL